MAGGGGLPIKATSVSRSHVDFNPQHHDHYHYHHDSTGLIGAKQFCKKFKCSMFKMAENFPPFPKISRSGHILAANLYIFIKPSAPISFENASSLCPVVPLEGFYNVALFCPFAIPKTQHARLSQIPIFSANTLKTCRRKGGKGTFRKGLFATLLQQRGRCSSR